MMFLVKCRLCKNADVPSWVVVGDQYIDRKFIRVEPTSPEPEEE